MFIQFASLFPFSLLGWTLAKERRHKSSTPWPRMLQVSNLRLRFPWQKWWYYWWLKFCIIWNIVPYQSHIKTIYIQLFQATERKLKRKGGINATLSTAECFPSIGEVSTFIPCRRDIGLDQECILLHVRDSQTLLEGDKICMKLWWILLNPKMKIESEKDNNHQ